MQQVAAQRLVSAETLAAQILSDGLDVPQIPGLPQALGILDAVRSRASGDPYIGRSREPNNRLLHLLVEQKLPRRHHEQRAFLTVLAVTNQIDHAKDLEEELLVYARRWSANESLGVGGKQDGELFTIYVHWLPADEDWANSLQCFDVMSEDDLWDGRAHSVGVHLATDLSPRDARDVLNSERRSGGGRGGRGRR
jgi:hypothetical protein